MKYVKNFLNNYKNNYIKEFNQELIRMRNNPLIFDVSYYTCKNNLECLKKTCTLVRSKQKIKVLDIGCGNKPFEKIFAEKNTCEFIGIDNNPNSKADFIQDITEPLPFKSYSFDLVILSEVLEHIPEPLKVINEIIRILKNDGILFMSTPLAFPIHGKPYDYFRYTEYFYKDHLKKIGLKCKYFYISNSIITTPILLIMQQINFFPFFPRLIKDFILAIMNIIIFIIEISLKPLYRFYSISSFLNSFPMGYAAVIKKIN